jgi:HEAT repeat protein
VERVQRDAEREGPVGEAFRGTAGRMSDRESIEALVASLTEVPDEVFEAVPALIEQFGPAAVRHLLDILARTENRRMRYRLLDLLAKLGPVVARDASALLSDPRWYVVRNMLLLLRRVGDSRSVLAVRRCVDHPDLRVRLEAIHTLFAFDRDVPRELLRRALHDPDLRQAEAAMELAGKYAIAEAVEPIVAYLAAWDPFGKRRAVRLKAIRALAAIGDPAALAGLGRFRSRYALPQPALEERRELFRTLPAYPEESYQAWIESGLRSRDAEIRRLCAAMGPGPGGAP